MKQIFIQLKTVKLFRIKSKRKKLEKLFIMDLINYYFIFKIIKQSVQTYDEVNGLSVITLIKNNDLNKTVHSEHKFRLVIKF